MSADITTAEARALDAVDAAAVTELLVEVMSIPSVTGSAAESELQHRLAKELDASGLHTDLWPVDLEEIRNHPDFPGAEAPRTEAWGLVGSSSGAEDDPTLVLQAHVDVVPPGEASLWQGDAFVPWVEGDLVRGRGACDMKAGLVANIACLRAIRTAQVALPGRIALHCVVSEEDGGLGAFATLQRGYTGDACIITEPTDRTLVTANAGALTFTLSVPGRATHGSTRYAGHSALDAFLPVYGALQRLEAERNRDVDPLMTEYPVAYPLSIGTVRAGDWASTVPAVLRAEGRLGVRLGEDPELARRQFEDCVAEACAADPWLRDHPATVAWTGGQFASGRLGAAHPLRDLVRQAHADVTGGHALRERGRRTAATCGCTPRTASPPCTTARATSVSPTVPTSTFRCPRSSRSPARSCWPACATRRSVADQARHRAIARRRQNDQLRRRARSTTSWVWCEPAPAVTARGRVSLTSTCQSPSRSAATSDGVT